MTAERWFQLWRFLRRRCRTVSLLMSSHFPKKWSVALLLSLSLLSTWVGSVDDCKFELVSFSSVGAVMDLVFLALDQGLANVSYGPNVLTSVGWVSIYLITTGFWFLKSLLNHRTGMPVLGFCRGQNKNQNQRTAGCGYLKNFKREQAVFMKEHVKNWWLYRHS